MSLFIGAGRHSAYVNWIVGTWHNRQVMRAGRQPGKEEEEEYIRNCIYCTPNGIRNGNLFFVLGIDIQLSLPDKVLPYTLGCNTPLVNNL
jgi:hypothetical protein